MKLTTSQIQELYRLYLEGWGVKALARRYGVHPPAIRYWLRRITPLQNRPSPTKNVVAQAVHDDAEKGRASNPKQGQTALRDEGEGSIGHPSPDSSQPPKPEKPVLPEPQPRPREYGEKPPDDPMVHLLLGALGYKRRFGGFWRREDDR